MGLFGKKKDDEMKKDEGGAVATKEKHEAEHVDEAGAKKPDVEVAGEVCEFC